VLHGVGPDDLAAALAAPAVPVLNSAGQVARWIEHGGGRPCDLMVDTGMNRLGVTVHEAHRAVAGGLGVATLMSHLACADEPAHPLNEEQLRAFEQVRRAVPAKRYSLANSAGIFLGSRYAFDLTRPGLALYGGVPVPGDADQAAAIGLVASLQAQIVQIREVPAGASVGYGATWRAPSARKVAILNLGYADGYLRALGSAGTATCDGQRLPLVGRVSMDLIAVDLEGGEERPPRLSEGDWLDVDYDLPRLSAASGLSQYELLTGLGDRFARRWV
jgi:alanine racemase